MNPLCVPVQLQETLPQKEQRYEEEVSGMLVSCWMQCYVCMALM